jgi:protein O-mannosyl-transferase
LKNLPVSPLRTPVNLCLFALLMIVAVLYLPSLNNVLVFDDNILTSGQVFAEYWNPLAMKPRALSYSTFSWLQRLAPEAWWLQRLVNVALHLAVLVVMYLFYSRLLVSLGIWSDATQPDAAADSVNGSLSETRAGRWALLAGIAWFALNPTAVYAVAYVAQRSLVMALLFSLLSLWAVLRALATRRARYWLLAVLAYLAAMLSKEYALALPALAVALIVMIRRPSRQQVIRLAVVGAVLGAVAAFALFKRYGELIGKPFDEVSVAYVKQLSLIAPGVEAYAWPLSILNQMWLFFEYGCRWFLPATSMMSIDMRPPYPLSFGSVPHVLGAIGYVSLLLGSVVLMLRYRGRLSLLGFCLFAPAILFVTEFSTVWIQDPFVLYRSYLWALAVPGVIFLLADRLSLRTLAWAAAPVAAIFLWQSTDRIASLRTELSVWDDAVNKLPPELVIGKSRAYLNRGQAFQLLGQDSRALRDYQRSTAFGDGGEGLLNAGSILLASGRPREALDAFDGAKLRGQVGASISLNRGSALAALGQHQAAFDSFSTGLTQAPGAQEAAGLRRQRAASALALGRIEDALADAEFAAAKFANDPQVRTTLGFAQLAKGNRPASIAAFNESIAKGPSGIAYFGLAQALASDGRTADARAAIAKAIALQPENVEFQRLQAKLGS